MTRNIVDVNLHGDVIIAVDFKKIEKQQALGAPKRYTSVLESTTKNPRMDGCKMSAINKCPQKAEKGRCTTDEKKPMDDKIIFFRKTFLMMIE